MLALFLLLATTSWVGQFFTAQQPILFLNSVSLFYLVLISVRLSLSLSLSLLRFWQSCAEAFIARCFRLSRTALGAAALLLTVSRSLWKHTWKHRWPLSPLFSLSLALTAQSYLYVQFADMAANASPKNLKWRGRAFSAQQFWKGSSINTMDRKRGKPYSSRYVLDYPLLRLLLNSAEYVSHFRGFQNFWKPISKKKKEINPFTPV